MGAVVCVKLGVCNISEAMISVTGGPKDPSPQVSSEIPACNEQIYCTQEVNICCTKSHSCSSIIFSQSH